MNFGIGVGVGVLVGVGVGVGVGRQAEQLLYFVPNTTFSQSKLPPNDVLVTSQQLEPFIEPTQDGSYNLYTSPTEGVVSPIIKYSVPVPHIFTK